MPKKQQSEPSLELESLTTPVVAATLAGVIYSAKLQNRQSKLNIPDQEVISDVLNLWRMVKDELSPGR